MNDLQTSPAATSKWPPSQDGLYAELSGAYGAALGRLARAYEADAESCRDLLQEIHVALWRSLAAFDGRCSMRTWVYRVAHNVGASHVMRDRRAKAQGLVSLDDAELPAGESGGEEAADRRFAVERLMELVQTLKPIDRQVILLYLEGVDAASIAEVTGISSGNVATKIHRIKNILIRRFHERGQS